MIEWNTERKQAAESAGARRPAAGKELTGMIRILFICHGNICRSPMAESYFTWLVGQAGLSRYFEIDSAATSREEIGSSPHRGTIQTLKKYGIPPVPHRARQMTAQDAAYYDLLIGMDEENMWCMQRITRGKAAEKMHMLLEFQADGSLQAAREVDDPWYTGNFESTWRDVKEGCAGLLAYCRRRWPDFRE